MPRSIRWTPDVSWSVLSVAAGHSYSAMQGDRGPVVQLRAYLTGIMRSIRLKSEQGQSGL